MLKKIFARFGEPSSYAGLAAVLMGMDQLFKINELEPVIDATHQAAEAVAATGSPTFGIAALLTGIAAIFLPEKKER